MFENKTFEYILKDMLDRVSSSLDKREGSIIYDAVAPASAEIAQLYIDLEVLIREAFASTASMSYLVLRAAERGLSPEPATAAVALGEFNVDVGKGARFNIDSFNYVTTELYEIDNDTGYYIYYMECETAGTASNGYVGTLTPINTITGLTHCELIEIVTNGEDDEDVEVFRQRYFDSLNSQAFGGNIADYKERVKAIEGVGGVRVYRADDWNGAGTVRLVIQDTKFKTPSDTFIDELQERIDPIPIQGSGEGIAPIGHIVTVEGVKSEEVSVSANFEIQAGYTFEGLKSEIMAAIGEYFDELNENWEDEDVNILNAKVVVAGMSVVGVKNITDVKFNDESGNLVINGDSIAMLKDVVNRGG